MMDADISPNFQPNATDAAITNGLMAYEGSPLAILYFAKHCDALSDYAYWFLLGSLWVSYSGLSDLALWRHLLQSARPKRNTSLMKPSEWEAFKRLPDKITAYRAHARQETDWISYTLDRTIAERFARSRDAGSIVEYELRKKDILALFLRREEQEILMLTPRLAKRVAQWPTSAHAVVSGGDLI